MYRPEMAHLKSYYRCDGVTTSDHIPVVATFDLRVPLCPPLQAYSHPCSIRIRSLTLDLTVHPLKLHRASLDFLDKIYVVFTGPFLAETSRAKRTGYATLRNADGTPRVGGARPAGSDMPPPANNAKADGSGGGGGSGGSSSAQQDEPDLRPTGEHSAQQLRHCTPSRSASLCWVARLCVFHASLSHPVAPDLSLC